MIAVILIFILVAYKTFVDRIIKEKDAQNLADIQHQKDLALENVKAQEEERKRIAVAVHDDLGNRLNILSLWLQNIEIEDEKASEVINGQIKELVDSARKISHNLYPVNLEKLGFILYVEELIANLSKKIEISLFELKPYQPKNIFTEVQIYRIIQEFTTNVIKHSEAENVKILLRDSEKILFVIISDNGKGFDYDLVKKGMGIKNIESRLQSLNAVFKWKSVLGKGIRLIIKTPVKNE